MADSLRVLALSPYHGGSHEQFLSKWSELSRHEFVHLTLPPRHFKWRIRQASVGMAEKVRELVAAGTRIDLIWTTSMMDVAELRGLLPAPLRTVPLVAYFHENQLAYPVRKEDERNQHFALINWVSALGADEVWYNSAFNRDSMLAGLGKLLRKMPDENSLSSLSAIEDKSRIEPLGVELLERTPKEPGPLHIAWVGRWEHDKRPDVFFAALRRLDDAGIPFRLSVLGQSFRTWPPEFDKARKDFSEQIEHFGFAPERADYVAALCCPDVVVSTAAHEFFGVALIEAVSAGLLPLVPRALVYPELYPDSCLYEVGEEPLTEALKALAKRKDEEGTLEREFDRLRLSELARRFDFDARASELDDSLSRCHQQATQGT